VRKRLALKVMRRNHRGHPAYRAATLARAMGVFLRAADREFERRNWVPITIVVQPQEGAVRPARAP
jgi:hypothetical protein